MHNSLPIVRTRAEHPISREHIDPDALKVLYRLSQEGHIAYLVGGGVRDLLRGVQPKDFDVSTDAHPNQIRRLFRDCFLIGRRFRLAHIKFGQKIIETSTFRRNPRHGEEDPETGSDLLQRHDNTFGTPEEDACRRDFTINGLFYDIRTFRLLDYVGGLADLEARLIRCIGDPEIRFREDPVRMVRAVRFASRLGFAIEEATYRAMKALHAEIRKASPARLHEEICKLFGYGVSEAAFRLLRETGLFQEMFPGPAARLSAAPPDGSLFWKCLGAFDVCEPKPGACPPSLVWAVLAYPWFEECITSDEGTHRREVHERCAHEAARLASGNIPLSRRAFAETFHLLISVARMRTSLGDWGSHGRRAARMRFAHHESFPMALKLWEVANRASGESIEDIHRWQAEAARAASTAPRHTERHSAAPGDRNRHPDFRGRPRRRRGRRHNFDRFRDTRDGSNPSAPQASLPE